MKAALIIEEQIKAIEDALQCLHTAMTDGFELSIDDINETLAIVKSLKVQEPVAWTTKDQIAAMDAGFRHYIDGRVPCFVLPTENDVPLYAGEQHE